MSKNQQFVAFFVGLGVCYFRSIEFRPPKAGEYFLSGAIATAGKAANDMTTAYTVVVPTHKALLKGHYERGSAIEESQL